MSSLPSPEGAKELLALMEKEEKLCAELEAAGAEVAKYQHAVARFKEAQEDYHLTMRAIGEALDKMDCSSPGNAGFEGRMGWLLMEMRRLILAKAKVVEPCTCATGNCAKHDREAADAQTQPT